MKQKSALQKLEKTIEAIEEKSDVEVVIIIAERSSSYRDLSYQAGSISGLLGCLFIVFSPFDFSHLLFVPELLLFFAFGYLLPGRMNFILKLLSSRERRCSEVESAAHLAFQRYGLSLTRRRTGMLIYLSLLEQDGHVLADVAVRRRVPGDRMGIFQKDLDLAAEAPSQLKALEIFLFQISPVLEKFIPALPDNPNELPNEVIWLKEMGPQV